MDNIIYKRYEQLRDLKGYTDYRIAKLAGIKGTATISNWKNGKYIPKDDKMQKIANVLEVPCDYLKGNISSIVCPECETNYDPINKQSCIFHEHQHEKYRKAITKYGFCFNSEECRNKMSSDMTIMSDSQKYPIEIVADAYIDYLKTKLSNLLRNSDYCIPYDSFDDYVKTQIVEDTEKNFIDTDLSAFLVNKYNINPAFINENELLFTRISHNNTLIQILKYMEQLNAQQLEVLKIQVKALAEQNIHG